MAAAASFPTADGRSFGFSLSCPRHQDAVAAGASSNSWIDAPHLRADWIRAMLREADSTTVRKMLAGAARDRGFESDLALAVMPWVAPMPVATAAEVRTARTMRGWPQPAPSMRASGRSRCGSHDAGRELAMREEEPTGGEQKGKEKINS